MLRTHDAKELEHSIMWQTFVNSKEGHQKWSTAIRRHARLFIPARKIAFGHSSFRQPIWLGRTLAVTMWLIGVTTSLQPARWLSI